MNHVKNYQTKQKNHILDILIEYKDTHLSGEEILSILNEKQTPVSRATLYRFLDHSITTGVIKKFNIKGNKNGYQYIGEEALDERSYSLKCEDCGKILVVENGSLNKANHKIAQEYSFLIDNARTVIYGLCKECRGKAI